MTRITFTKEKMFDETIITKVELEGHAGYATFGKDIVCAGISMASQMAITGITEVAHVKARVERDPDKGHLTIDVSSGPFIVTVEAQPFLQALELVLKQLSNQYPDNVHVCERLI